MILREAARQRIDHLARIVDRKRRLRHIGEIALVDAGQLFDILRRLHQDDRALRQLAERADDFRMAGMADEDHLMAAAEMRLRLAVHLGHQRAGRVERENLAAYPHRHGPTSARHAPRR